MAETVGDTETILPGEVPEGEFQPVTVGKKFSLPAISAKSKSWELPAELAEFLQERCNSYLSDKELEEFLTTNTPDNVKGATKLDPFLKSLLDKKGNFGRRRTAKSPSETVSSYGTTICGVGNSSRSCERRGRANP